MTSLQITAVNMLLRVQQVFTKRKSLFEGFIPLKNKMTGFNIVMTRLDDDIKAQASATQNTTLNKDTAKRNAIKLLMPLAEKAYDWAIEENDVVLKELFDVNNSDFNGDEIEAAALAENIINAINAIVNKLADYNVTQQQVDAAATAISDFKKLIGTPQVVQVSSKVLNGNINKDIKDAKNILLRCDKLIRAEFKTSEPDAYKDYEGARFQGSSTRQHTALAVTVVDENDNFIANATVSLTEIDRNDVTDETGLAEIIKFKAGTYNGTVTAAGFANAAFSFTVKSGKKAEVEVVMTK